MFQIFEVHGCVYINFVTDNAWTVEVLLEASVPDSLKVIIVELPNSVYGALAIIHGPVCDTLCSRLA